MGAVYGCENLWDYIQQHLSIGAWPDGKQVSIPLFGRISVIGFELSLQAFLFYSS